ncbi:MAG: CHASE2 domain-containing protein, partial [Bacteroidetes bacterium]|nr:CHASE2 domain-containing protein [Bacteroidota bacterium]
MRILLFFLLAVPLFSAEMPARSPFVTVALTASDIEQFGGWPIPRRWYANLIQKANASGASAIAVDIAFITADPLHPESDEYFYDVLTQYPNVSILVPGITELNGPVTILGDKTLNPDRVFRPFSHGVAFYGERPMLTDTTILTSKILSTYSAGGLNCIVDFPGSALTSDLSFREALTEEISWKGKVVIISVENPGVTSYIVSPSGQRQSTTLLQVWMAQQILNGDFVRLLPFWEYSIIGVFCSFPLFWFGLKGRKILGAAVSTVCWILSL